MKYREILEKCWQGYVQRGMKPKGDRMVPNCVPVKEMEEDLKKWFRQKWVRFGPDGKIKGDCARGSSKEGKPKCLPKAKAEAMSKEERQTIVARKRKSDPNPERKGPAKMVSSKVDAIDPLKTSGFLLSDDEEAAFVSPEDIDAALNQWKELAPERFRDLLEAEDVQPS